jgi:hypothetical protein
MALSNWDTLAFNSEGEPCNGVFEGFDGQSCAIYKNWLYVRDPKMWSKDRSFVEPTIAEFSHGEMRLSGMTIVGERGPQNAIFVYVEATKYGDEKKGEETVTKRMAGIGCYGFSDPVPALCKHFKVNPDDYDDVFAGSTGTGKEGESYTILMCTKEGHPPKEFRTETKEELESQWVGVTTDTYAKFLEFLQRVAEDHGYGDDFKAWHKKIVESEPLRVNQGDMYFADRIPDLAKQGVATKIGEGGDPLLIQACKEMKNKGE